MGLLSSSRSRNTTNNEENNFNNVDNRLVEADKAMIGGNVSINSAGDLSAVTVTTTDFGALDAANQLSKDTFGAVKSIASDALNIASKAAEDDSSETLKYLVIGLSTVGIAFAVFAFKK